MKTEPITEGERLLVVLDVAVEYKRKYLDLSNAENLIAFSAEREALMYQKMVHAAIRTADALSFPPKHKAALLNAINQVKADFENGTS